MGHNNVVSGQLKSTGIPRVYGVVNGTLGFRVSQQISNFFFLTFSFYKNHNIDLQVGHKPKTKLGS